MQDDTSPKGLKGTFNKHWEKIGLGAAVVVLAAFVGMNAASKTPEIETAAKVMAQVANQERSANKAVPKPDPVPPAHADLVAVAATNAPPFAGSVRTQYVGVPNFGGTIEQGIQYRIFGGRMEEPVVQIEGMQVSLVVDLTLPKGVKPEDKTQRWFNPTHFLIERRIGTSDKWEKIIDKLEVGKLDPNSKEPKVLHFLDSKIQPKTEYSYRATPICEDPAFVKPSDKKAIKEPPKPSNIASQKSAGLWEITWSNANAGDEDAGKPPSIRVKIKKFDPEAGTVEKSFTQVVPSKLGFAADEKDAEPSFKHKVYSEKLRKQVDVDFDCKCELKKILFDKLVEYTYERCKVKQTPTGPVCEGKETVKDSFKTHEVQFIDDEKKPQVYHMSSIRKQNQLCEEHGGPKKPVLTPEEIKAKRAEDLKKLIEEADALWTNKAAKKKKPEIEADKKAGQKKYKEILSEYKDDLDETQKKAIELRANEKL